MLQLLGEAVTHHMRLISHMSYTLKALTFRPRAVTLTVQLHDVDTASNRQTIEKATKLWSSSTTIMYDTTSWNADTHHLAKEA